jgi:D-beta-D-heptose 7-phosphate kinase/D-beta-D-heptose 1-phosphate adenosyltransferase
MSAPSITDLAAAQSEREALRARGRRVVFTNGCFDILHPGHLRLLESARGEGDFLIVGLNSDHSVRAIKGPQRPVLSESERAANLGALECVDCVLLYDEPTPLCIIEALLPDVLVKGADWALEAIVGREVVEAAGGRVARVELVEGRSTTAVLDRIRLP